MKTSLKLKLQRDKLRTDMLDTIEEHVTRISGDMLESYVDLEIFYQDINDQEATYIVRVGRIKVWIQDPGLDNDYDVFLSALDPDTLLKIIEELETI